MTDSNQSFLDTPMEDLDLLHYGVLGMKWGVRKEESRERIARAKKQERRGTRTRKAPNTPKDRAARQLEKTSKLREAIRTKAYSTYNKVAPRELNYSLKKTFMRHKPSEAAMKEVIEDSVRNKGVVPTDKSLTSILTKEGIKKHKETVYDNLDKTDINRLKKYTDAAVYSRTINSYLATGEPPHIAPQAKALKDSLSKNSLSDMTVYRSTSLTFSTEGLNKKLQEMGVEELAKAFDQFSSNFKGKTFKENRVYSTSTSPEFAIDTWREVNPNAAKTYNTYMVIDLKGSPGVLADGRTSNGETLVNTRSNQEAILAPNSMTYKKLTWDSEREMFAIHMEAR